MRLNFWLLMLPQIASPGEYKLCMLQFWVPPDKLTGDVVVLGVDDIGTVVVHDLPKPKSPESAETAEKAAADAEMEASTVAGQTMQPLPISATHVKDDDSSDTSHSSSDKEALSYAPQAVMIKTNAIPTHQSEHAQSQ